MLIAAVTEKTHTLRLLHAADPGSLWLTWNLDPVLLVGIALLVSAYCYALGPLRRRYGWADSVPRGQVALFFVGTALFALALISPLDTLGDEYLFSAHMVQHMLIAVVVPPLWLLGTPEWMLAPLLRRPRVLRVARWLTLPAVAFALFNFDLWIWHVPTLYDATLANAAIHIFEHLTFVVTGVLFWWPIVSPVRALPRIAPGVGILYLFLGCQPMVVLGALLTFAPQPLYAPYVAAPRLWGTTAIGDQQLGGLIMWLPTSIPYLLGLSVLFFKWVGIRDRIERGEAGEFDDSTAPSNTSSAAPQPVAADALGEG